MAPNGTAPGAHHRLLAVREDGSKDYALVLARGDEIATALGDFARAEKVVAARFSAIGAVQDPEVAWFDPVAKRYKAMAFAPNVGAGADGHAQLEVLALTGDIGVGPSGQPLVHAHVVLGGADGSTVGGHLVGATTSPTLEVFVTTWPKPLAKKPHLETELLLFDLGAPAAP
jgi:predicted DNA-binding protein with PD1-like motif